MTREEAKHMAAVLKAWSEGKICQSKYDTPSGWLDLNTECVHFEINHGHCYRIAPVPREWWLNIYPNPPETLCMCTSKAEADRIRSPGRIKCVHVREVLEDEP